MKTGEVERAIWSLKFGTPTEQTAWASIFGRVLAGFLDDHASLFRRFGLIVATPAWLGEGGRSFDPVRAVVRAADAEAGGLWWPFDVEDAAAIVKTADTPRMTGRKWRERHEIAQGPLRDALSVPRPERIRDLVVLVVDDVFTDGHTLNEVALALTLHGATAVCGVTLARQPYTPPVARS